MGLFGVLKFALWLLKFFVKKPKKKRSELEKKQRKYVRNFAKKNISYQQSLGKDKKRTRKSKKDRKFSNNSKG